MESSQERYCFTCHKAQTNLPEPLKRCAGCSKVYYCSKSCQKANWKFHKVACKDQQGSSATPPPFLSLGVGEDALRQLSKSDVFCALVDCFRMRVEDEYKFKGNNMGILDDHSRCLPDFRRFLDLAESRSGVLPSWWTAEKRQECEVFAVKSMAGDYKDRGDPEGNIYAFTEKSDIREHYSDNMMPMKLRFLGESIYGVGLMPI